MYVCVDCVFLTCAHIYAAHGGAASAVRVRRRPQAACGEESQEVYQGGQGHRRAAAGLLRRLRAGAYGALSPITRVRLPRNPSKNELKSVTGSRDEAVPSSAFARRFRLLWNSAHRSDGAYVRIHASRIMSLRSSSNMDSQHMKRGEQGNQKGEEFQPAKRARKAYFPVCFGSFTCPQTRHVGPCLTRTVILV